MKTFAHLGGLLYGRPHLITQTALDGLHQGFQQLIGAGNADLSDVAGELAAIAGKFTGLSGFRLEEEKGAKDGWDESGFFRVGQVAVVKLSGIIGRNIGFLKRCCAGGCDLNYVDEALKGADMADDIEQIVLASDSPGGTAQGTPETAALFRDIGQRKRTYAFTNGECCSAAYFIASQAHQLFCSRSAVIGSIGVRSVFLDKTMQLAGEGVKVNAISSGKWKCSGASWKEMDVEERAMFQALCDQIYEDFKAAVTTARPQVADETMQGQVFIGEKAVGAGLADGLIDDLEALVTTLLLEPAPV